MCRVQPCAFLTEKKIQNKCETERWGKKSQAADYNVVCILYLMRREEINFLRSFFVWKKILCFAKKKEGAQWRRRKTHKRCCQFFLYFTFVFSFSIFLNILLFFSGGIDDKNHKIENKSTFLRVLNCCLFNALENIFVFGSYKSRGQFLVRKMCWHGWSSFVWTIKEKQMIFW